MGEPVLIKYQVSLDFFFELQLQLSEVAAEGALGSLCCVHIVALIFAGLVPELVRILACVEEVDEFGLDQTMDDKPIEVDDLRLQPANQQFLEVVG